ncbi:MAG: TIGR01906 family membrane protein [Christensenellaceae bacterium]|nr:TIGR01906 family membrane protein [Christensenellaceae bacterium]
MKRFFAAMAGFFLLLGILFLSIDSWCFADAFYKKEYAKLGTAESIGISEEDLGNATDALLDYLQGKREDLVTYADFESVGECEVFNEKEKLHMVDVRVLYLNARVLLLGLGGIGLVILVFLFIKNKKKALIPVLAGYMDANVILLAFAAAIGVFVLVDFDTFWTNFHHIFFTNDLWLLDPRTDVLINMVPGQFFFDLVFGIACSFLAVTLLLYAAAAIARKRLIRSEG